MAQTESRAERMLRLRREARHHKSQRAHHHRALARTMSELAGMEAEDRRRGMTLSVIDPDGDLLDGEEGDLHGRCPAS